MVFKDKFAGIEYVGVPGISKECQEAVMRLIQFGDHISLARILSFNGTHCLLLTVNGDSVAVKSGFGSGYGGEGPRRFSYTLQILEAHKAKIEEYDVNKAFLNRLDNSMLTVADLKKLRKLQPVRPTRWHEYISEKHYDQFRGGLLWQEFPSIIPFGVVDDRIADLAVSFWDNPDTNLLTGYRRLEDIIRARIGTEESGAKLFSQAFGGENSILSWKNIGQAEKIGRTNLFTGAYMAHRNPRAHVEPKDRKLNQLLSEFFLLNHLYLLEREAYKVIKLSLKN